MVHACARACRCAPALQLTPTCQSSPAAAAEAPPSEQPPSGPPLPAGSSACACDQRRLSSRPLAVAALRPTRALRTRLSNTIAGAGGGAPSCRRERWRRRRGRSQRAAAAGSQLQHALQGGSGSCHNLPSPLRVTQAAGAPMKMGRAATPCSAFGGNAHAPQADCQTTSASTGAVRASCRQVLECRLSALECFPRLSASAGPR